jgi:hypothetical protein
MNWNESGKKLSLKILSQYLPGEAKENHKKCQESQSLG